MSQSRLRNFQHPILSFEHNMFNLGLHSPGRYVGFDTLAKITGLTFNISHAGFDLRFISPNANNNGPIGVYMTPQGTLIQETAPIGQFTIDTNAGNTSVRYDVLYAAHDQVEIGGGGAATYIIVKGPIGSEIKPTVPNPLKNTILGYIKIPANENVDINNCTWIKAKSPDSGDNLDARLDYVNIFTKFQGYKLSSVTLTVPTFSANVSSIIRQFWQLGDDGNTFKILPSAFSYTLDAISLKDVPLQDGFRIYIQINEKVGLRPFTVLDPTQIANGYRGFTFNPDFANSFNSVNQILPSANEIWEVEALLQGNNWQIMKIGGRSTGNVPGEMKVWAGLLNKVPNGWLVCDGRSLLVADYPALSNNIGTTFGGDGITNFSIPRLQGKVPVGFDIGDVDFTFGHAGGQKEVILTKAQLPADASSGTGAVPQGGFGLIRRSVTGETNTIAGSLDNNNSGNEPDILGIPQKLDFAGENAPHTNMPPYLTLCWIIKT